MRLDINATQSQSFTFIANRSDISGAYAHARIHTHTYHCTLMTSHLHPQFFTLAHAKDPSQMSVTHAHTRSMWAFHVYIICAQKTLVVLMFSACDRPHTCTAAAHTHTHTRIRARGAFKRRARAGDDAKLPQHTTHRTQHHSTYYCRRPTRLGSNTNKTTATGAYGDRERNTQFAVCYETERCTTRAKPSNRSSGKNRRVGRVDSISICLDGGVKTREASSGNGERNVCKCGALSACMVDSLKKTVGSSGAQCCYFYSFQIVYGNRNVIYNLWWMLGIVCGFVYLWFKALLFRHGDEMCTIKMEFVSFL